MKSGPNLASIATLIGDRARADMLSALMSGKALTATELAIAADITKQTASTHLAKLRTGNLLAMEHQGRHRYFRLANEDVASLLESLMDLAHRSNAPALLLGPTDPALRRARVCYDHLAGELGVQVFDGFKRQRLLQLTEDALTLTPKGQVYCRDLGIDLDALAASRRPLCRACLDWSERRHHLAGALGAAFLERCFTLGWARRAKNSRVVNFTALGERALRDKFSFRS